ncbi:DUF6273 domain-containing protein [Acetobacterium woodii]|uniref:DUF6273 domain-containing protein n=1 Tax=Acetobacterium woodii (strain ATCC 29683 / DSM 1030 / JCM 2381 / KCTC 1655 / WB1) TaxID=931626 RepID=H6LD97_ACEWD|nr:DUF6273 domain-containing protein [Acetobacterium woodii]AFA49142.1 hypothetical protein Awo_c23690 [Acetobacterium woodii DSM 1030]
MIKSKLDDFSWREISDRIALGLVEECFEIGASKKVELQNGEQLIVQVYDFNHDLCENSQSKSAITFGLKFLMSNERRMNADEAAFAGWEKSEMRRWLNEDLFYQLPEELQNEILPVEKQTVGEIKDQPIITTVERLFLFSEVEIFGKNEHSGYGEGSQYPIFKNNRSRRFAGGETYPYHTRSLGPYDTYVTVLSDGSNDYGNLSAGVNFGFCIGVYDQTKTKRSAAEISKAAVFNQTIETVIQNIREVQKQQQDHADQQLVIMVRLIEQINDYVWKHPEYITKNKQLMNYYLPTTLELMQSYQKYQSSREQDRHRAKIIAEIQESFYVLNSAYQTMIDDFYQAEYLDVSTDIAVLKAIASDDKWE